MVLWFLVVLVPGFILLSFVVAWRARRRITTATDFFLGGRTVSPLVFALGMSATIYSGWSFTGHPGLIFRDGFQYAFAGLYAVTIPLFGIVFMKRQWAIGRRLGFVTQGEMLASYYQSDGIRFLAIVAGFFFAIPYAGLQLGAIGFVLNMATDGILSTNTGVVMAAIVVGVFLSLGGFRSFAQLSALYFLLAIVGMTIVSVIALDLVGGWSSLQDGLGKIGATDVGKWGLTQEDDGVGHNAYFAVPGAIQLTSGLGRETPIGGIWTGAMIVTYLLFGIGAQASPIASTWALAARSPKGFAFQQFWLSALVVGGILVIGSSIQGMSANLLGAGPQLKEAGFVLDTILPESVGQRTNSLVPHYLLIVAEALPLLVAFLFLCAIAAMLSTAAAHCFSYATMLTRDLHKRFERPAMNHASQMRLARMYVAFILFAGALTAVISQDTLVTLGGFAMACGAQLGPALLGLCWWPRLTRAGVRWGIIVGLMVVILVEPYGLMIVEPPWGRWPLTMHSVVWGLFFNLLVCIVVSAATQNDSDRQNRLEYHRFFHQTVPAPRAKRNRIKFALGLIALWLLIGVGPGATIGNDLFGRPDEAATWLFGIPSIWAWIILAWISGTAIVGYLAYRLEFSVAPEQDIKPLVNDVGDFDHTIVESVPVKK